MTTLGDERVDGDLAALAESRADPDRFAVLFDRYHTAIHRYAAGRLGGGRADDVAAETFLVAFRSRDRFTTAAGGSVRAWLYGIATNLIRHHHRDEERRYRALARAGGRAGAGVPPSGGDDAVLGRLAAAEVRGALADALARLPAADRDALLLVALGQLDYAEVAAALGIPAGTVGSRLTRARRAVRAALGGADPTRIDEGI